MPSQPNESVREDVAHILQYAMLAISVAQLLPAVSADELLNLLGGVKERATTALGKLDGLAAEPGHLAPVGRGAQEPYRSTMARARSSNSTRWWRS